MVYEVTVGKDGRANGVRFVDATTGQHEHVTARVVVLGASACETARILLNSKSGQFPNGVANSSGLVGRYVLDTVGSSVSGQIPLLESLPPLNEDAADGLQVYVPWWLYQEQLAHKLPFPRGYHIEYGGGKGMPSVGTFSGLEWLTGGSYGKKFKEDARRYYGSFIIFDGRGAMVPNDNCYVEIDPNVKDKFGIPVLRFHWQWGDYEQRQAVHMQETFGQVIEAMGGRMQSPVITDPVKAVAPGGYMIHEVGGTIMGADARSLRHQQVVTDLGRAQPLRGRWRRVPLQRGQEPDPDHHGAVVAHVRSHPGSDAEAGDMTDRRTTIKLIIAAAAAFPALRARANYMSGAGRVGARQSCGNSSPPCTGYGPDPDLIKAYEKGAFWPLTMNAQQRQLAAALSDLIIPEDEHSPSASAVGVVDFIDEWISAPYPLQREDRATVLDGFAWLDGEAQQRFAAAVRQAARGTAARDLRPHLRCEPRRGGAAGAGAILRHLPQPDGGGVLYHPRRPQGPASTSATWHSLISTALPSSYSRSWGSHENFPLTRKAHSWALGLALALVLSLGRRECSRPRQQPPGVDTKARG